MPFKRAYSRVKSAIVHGAKKLRGFGKGPARAAASAVKQELGSVLTGLARQGASGAVTGQHDSKMLYRRRRAPKKVRMRARRRAKMFLKRQLSNKSSNTNLFQKNGTISALANAQDAYTITSGYTWGTGSGDRVGDVYNVIQNMLNSEPHNSAQDFYLMGMSTDYTIKNGSTENVEIDVYEYVIRKDLEFQIGAATTSLIDFINNAQGDETKLPGATNAMSSSNLGWVPTDANKAMRYIVIKTKQRFYIGPEQAISFTKRTKFFRPVKYTAQDFDNAVNGESANIITAKAGVTRGIIIVSRGLPDDGVASAASTLYYNAQTRYTMKQVDTNPDRSAVGF